MLTASLIALSAAVLSLHSTHLHGKRAVLIDLDGTLLDTAPELVASVNALLLSRGLEPLPETCVRNLIGKGVAHLVTGAMQLSMRAAPDAYTIAQAIEQFNAIYWRFNGTQARLYPEAFNGLTALRGAGLKTACVTNKPTEFARTLLHNVGLATYFTQVTGGDSYPRKKPDPMPLLKTCELMQAEPGRTLMIGDSVYDAHAAKAAGCPLVLVTYGYHHQAPLHQLGALQCVDRLDALAFDTL